MGALRLSLEASGHQGRHDRGHRRGLCVARSAGRRMVAEAWLQGVRASRQNRGAVAMGRDQRLVGGHRGPHGHGRGPRTVEGAALLAHKFDTARMAVLESDERRRRQPPERLLSAIGVVAGTRFADIGCGPGFYALPAAHAVGQAGRVFALDVQEAMVARVRERAAAEGLTNVEAMRSAESRLPLPDAAADVALVANVLHECVEPVALLREVRRVLAPGGRVVIVEWRKEAMEMGPPVAERMSEGEVQGALAAAGFGEALGLDAGAAAPTHFGFVAQAGRG